MLTEFSFSNEWKTFSDRRLLGALRMNQYQSNWPVVLSALRQLWEKGKMTKLETPYFEPVAQPWRK